MEQITPGLTRPIATVEIDPGPLMIALLAYDLAHLRGLPVSHVTTASTSAAPPPSPQRPDGKLQPTGVGCDGTSAAAAGGTDGSHLGTNGNEAGGIAFKRPRYPCPFPSRLPAATPDGETFGSTWAALRKHLTMTDNFRRRQSPPGIHVLPLPAHASAETKPLGNAASVGSGELVCHQCDVTGFGSGGDVARSRTSRVGEKTCVPKFNDGLGTWLAEYPEPEEEAHDERMGLMKSAPYESGDEVDGGIATGMHHLIFGNGQHASLCNDLDGNSRSNGNAPVEAGADASSMRKAWPKEIWDNPHWLHECKSAFLEGLTVHMAGTRPQHELRRPNRNLATASLTAPWKTSSRGLSTGKQGLIDSSSSKTRLIAPEAMMCLRFPASTSWSSSVDAAGVSLRDILMWMIGYNLRNNVRAKQCTGIVDCLLEEPG
ncbi:cholesterol oxidase [Diaporthe helianthi]|uniref:Cholesterol oxidase n=1 Tax=Diaporthe helianthi TaxID=158607 RepID=A0A2P5HZR9_DIAHE|nr:cholesterol oxidase [Diaporthe helianthi]